MKKVIRLPKELAPHKDLLKETITSFLSLEPTPVAPELPWESKIGGVPYMELDSNYPVDSEGKPMFFLVQISCEELKNIPGFPTTGLLQFFMAENGMYGEPIETKAAVNYISEVNTDLDALIKALPNVSYEDLPLDISKTYGITANRSMEIAPLSDIAFDGKMGNHFFRNYGDEEFDMRDKYSAAVSAAGHKMGGYAHFAQEDPRAPGHDEILLLQLDSDDQIGMKWGDMGVAHFFIRKENLEQLDFSQVTFHWDCH